MHNFFREFTLYTDENPFRITMEYFRASWKVR
jgi:hypothetical protein